MTKPKRSIVEICNNFKREYIIAIFIIGTCAAIALSGVAPPVKASIYTQTWAECFTSLPEGSTVLQVSGFGSQKQSTIWEMRSTIIYLSQLQDYKLYLVPTLTDDAIMIDVALKELEPRFAELGKEYGVDYVLLPLHPANAAAGINSLMDDVWTALGGSDYYGNSFEDLPIMEHFKSAADLDLLVLGAAACTTGDVCLRVYYPRLKDNPSLWPTHDGTPILSYSQSACFLNWLVYVGEHTMLISHLDGNLGTSSMQFLLGVKPIHANASGIIFARTFAMAYTIVLVMIGTAASLILRREVIE